MQQFIRCLACASLLLPWFPVPAQDGVMLSGDNMMYAVPDYGSIALTQSILESTKHRQRERTGRSSEPDSRVGEPASTRQSTASLGEARVHYDPAVSKALEREYLRNLEKSIGRAPANALGAYFAEHPVQAQFDAIAAPYGLRKQELLDVVAGYFAVMWMAANQAPSPTRVQVQGLRAQLGHGANDGVSVPQDMAQRQRMAETIMYRLVQMTMLREEMRKRGDRAGLQALADSARRDVQGDGMDLRSMRLTSSGFESQ